MSDHKVWSNFATRKLRRLILNRFDFVPLSPTYEFKVVHLKCIYVNMVKFYSRRSWLHPKLIEMYYKTQDIAYIFYSCVLFMYTYGRINFVSIYVEVKFGHG